MNGFGGCEPGRAEHGRAVRADPPILRSPPRACTKPRLCAIPPRQVSRLGVQRYHARARTAPTRPTSRLRSSDRRRLARRVRLHAADSATGAPLATAPLTFGQFLSQASGIIEGTTRARPSGGFDGAPCSRRSKGAGQVNLDARKHSRSADAFVVAEDALPILRTLRSTSTSRPAARARVDEHRPDASAACAIRHGGGSLRAAVKGEPPFSGGRSGGRGTVSFAFTDLLMDIREGH